MIHELLINLVFIEFGPAEFESSACQAGSLSLSADPTHHAFYFLTKTHFSHMPGWKLVPPSPPGWAEVEEGPRKLSVRPQTTIGRGSTTSVMHMPSMDALIF